MKDTSLHDRRRAGDCFGLCLSMHSAYAVITHVKCSKYFSDRLQVGKASESARGINWSTIIFIAGMMIMVEGMGRTRFFRWLCLRLAKLVNYRVIPLLISFMCMSGILAMFIDSITVILFLVAVTAELSRLLKFNPVPVIIAEIFCANLGGAATMCGDPPNIIIGTSLGYTFFDFLHNTGFIVLICFTVTIAYFYLFLQKDLKASEAARGRGVTYPDPAHAVKNKRRLSAAADFLHHRIFTDQHIP
jgi:Na+/H+ antiporter NhaD/arsenite permease-like protein